SVYLPQRVLPMFPELISNGLASLQQGKLRYVKSAFIEFTADGQRVGARFANAAIKVTRRFSYEQGWAIYQSANPPPPPLFRQAGGGEITPPPSPPLRGRGAGREGVPPVAPDVRALLLRMRDLAMLLRKRRFKRGALELTMPEVELEYDDRGRVTG